MPGKITAVMLTLLFWSTVTICAQETVQNAADEGHPLNGARGGVHVSTLGTGAFAAWDVSDAFAIRGSANYFGYDLDRELSGIEYTVDLQLQSFGLLLDWHAFRGGFRVSGGAFVHRNELSAVAEASDIEIGEGLYHGVLDALVDFGSLAPYLGLGWSSRHGRSGFSVGVEAGILFHGTPKLRATGMADLEGVECRFAISEGGETTFSSCPASALLVDALKDDLEAEHREVSGNLDNFQLYPVVALSVLYRF